AACKASMAARIDWSISFQFSVTPAIFHSPIVSQRHLSHHKLHPLLELSVNYRSKSELLPPTYFPYTPPFSPSFTHGATSRSKLKTVHCRIATCLYIAGAATKPMQPTRAAVAGLSKHSCVRGTAVLASKFQCQRKRPLACLKRGDTPCAHFC